MWPWPRPTFVLSGILIYPAVWSQQIWAENWGLCPFLKGGSWVHIKHNVAWSKAHLCSKWHPYSSSRLTTTDNWGTAPLWGRELGPHPKQRGWGQGLPPCQVSSWSTQPFGHNTPKLQTGRTDRQRDRRTTVRQHRTNSFTNGRPKSTMLTMYATMITLIYANTN